MAMDVKKGASEKYEVEAGGEHGDVFDMMSELVSMVKLRCADKESDLRVKYGLPGPCQNGERVWVLRAINSTNKWRRLLESQGHDVLTSVYVSRPKPVAQGGGLDYRIAEGGDRCLQVWVVSEQNITLKGQGHIQTEKAPDNTRSKEKSIDCAPPFREGRRNDQALPPLKRVRMSSSDINENAGSDQNDEEEKNEKEARALPILLREIKSGVSSNGSAEWELCGAVVGENIYNEYRMLSGLWLWLPQNEGEFMNDEFFQQLGYDRRIQSRFPAHHPESWFELIDPADLVRAQNCFNACEATHGRADYDLRVKYRRIDGGRIHLQCRGAPILWSQHGKILALGGCHSDVSIENQERPGRISFIGKISHEIRTPLNAVFGAISLLQEEDFDTNANESVRKDYSVSRENSNQAEHTDSRKAQQDRTMALRILNQSVVQVNRVVNDVLDYSALSSGKLKLVPKVVSIRQLSESVVQMFQGDARQKDIDLSCHVESRLPRVYVDPVRLTQVLSNLISNSLKFTSRNGTVELIVGRTPLGVHGTVSGNSSQSTPMDSQCFFTIDVKDSGCGIARSQWSIIFEDFEQARVADVHMGSGLGLAVVFKLINLHGGRVYVHESTIGHGTTMRILIGLPIASESTVSNSPRNKSRHAGDASLPSPFSSMPTTPTSISRQESRKFSEICSRVLIVDDVQTNRFVISAILRKLAPNIEVFEADNGRGATQFVQNAQSGQHPSVDIILMDLHMPHMDGIEATRLCRAIDPTVLILGFTANTDSTARAMCLEAGMCDVLLKPTTRTALEAAIRKVLGDSAGNSLSMLGS